MLSLGSAYHVTLSPSHPAPLWPGASPPAPAPPPRPQPHSRSGGRRASPHPGPGCECPGHGPQARAPLGTWDPAWRS